MKRFVVIGLGQFGKCMVEILAKRKCEVLVIDRDEAKVEWARDIATQAVRADALNAELFQEVLPNGIECAVVDIGDRMEPSILATNHLHKIGVPKIVVQALSPDHAEILQIVGATRVIFPEREAAERLAGMLAGRGALDFFPVSADFSLVEVPVPESWMGKKLRDLDLRKNDALHVVAKRSGASENQPWQLPDPEAVFAPEEIVLLAGKSESLEKLEK